MSHKIPNKKYTIDKLDNTSLRYVGQSAHLQAIYIMHDLRVQKQQS